MSRQILLTLASILFVQIFTVNQASAQVGSTYLNVLCVWHPYTPGNYEIHVYRQPGQTLVHTIMDPAITSLACTASASDLAAWVQSDLMANGTSNRLNDQLHTQLDVFCPGPDVPTVINSMMASMSYSAQSGEPQAGLVVNYTCPGAGSGVGSVGSNPTPDVTYNPETCGPCSEASNQALVQFFEDPAVVMSNVGPSTMSPNTNVWKIGLAAISPPSPVNNNLPASVTHCDQDAVNAAQAYIQANIASLNPADFGVDAWLCPTNQIVVGITQCKNHGTHSSYGYRIDCCAQ